MAISPRWPAVRKFLVALIVTCILTCPAPALSQVQEGASTASDPAAAQNVNLDLSSTSRDLFPSPTFSQIDIHEGDSTRTITPRDLVTPAELIAIQQVLSGGAQTLQLGSLGNATGGTVYLSQHVSQPLSQLVVPAAVTAIYDAGVVPSLSIVGNLTNGGSLYAVSSSPAVTNATITATNIVNNAQAVLSTVVPGSLLCDGTRFVSDLGLTLNALENIINHGTISSAGDLNLTAGGSIINTSTLAGQAAVMQALGSLNLQTNSLINSGLLSASANINVVSQMVSDLVINNLGGRLEALSGDINLRDSLFAGKADTLLTGGDILAQELNIFSGTGKALVNTRELTALVNIRAHEAQVTSSTKTLLLGAIELTGDPAIVNTGGNVAISGNLTFAGQDLSVIASGDIFTTTSGLRIDTSSSTDNGGNILMAAGANAILNGSTLEITQGTSPGGGSEPGGKIDLGTNPITLFTSRGGLSSGLGNGGNITLIAYAGSSPASGTVRLPSATNVATGGRGTGSNGNLTLIAGAANGPANSITIGSVNTTGGANGTGNITLSTAIPTIVDGPVLISTSSGAQSGGKFVAGTPQYASVAAGALSTPGAAISVTAGANAALASLSSVGSSNLPGSTGGLIEVAVNRVADSGQAFVLGGPNGCSNCTTSGLTATSNTSGLNGKAGTIKVSNYGSGGIRVNNLALLSTPVLTLNGSGGRITLDAAAGASAGPLNIVGGAMSANASGNGNGGQIVLRGSSLVNSINTSPWSFAARGSTSGVGDGGMVSITTTDAGAHLDSGTGAGQVSSINVLSGAAGGSGGTIALSAGGNLTVDTQTLSARPLGTNGNGSTFLLAAGTAGTGIIQLTGSLNANGSGSGSGGTITINFSDAGSFVIGAASAGGGIAGNLSSIAPGSGLDGSITIQNTATYGGSITLASGASITGGELTIHTRGGSVTVSAGGSISGDKIDMQAGSLTNDGSIMAATGRLSLLGNALDGNLTVTLGAGSQLAAGGVEGQLEIRGTGEVTVSGAGSIASPAISLVSEQGGVSATVGAIAGTLTGSAATNFTLETTNSGLTAGTISAANGSLLLTAAGPLRIDSGTVSTVNGSLSLTAAAGALEIAPGTTLSVCEGNLVLNSRDTVSGSISLGDGVTLRATTGSQTLGRIFVVIGDIPTSPTAGTAPPYLTVNLLNYGQIFFGANSITAACCNSTVTVDGSVVVFNTGSLPATAITLGPNTSLYAQSAPPPAPPPPPEPAAIPPGHGGTPPGLGGLPPGLGGDRPPGLGGTPPGQGGTPPGLESQPPGLGGTAPGLGGTPPGQFKKLKASADQRTHDGNDSSDITLVSFIQPAAPPSGRIWQVKAPGCLVLHSERAALAQTRHGALRLREGEILVYAERPVEILSGEHQLSMRRGTLALISMDANMLIVRNLHHRSLQSMRVIVDKRHSVDLALGQELIVAPDSAALEHNLGREGLARRRTHRTHLRDGGVVLTAEFSMISLIKSSPTVGNLVHSPTARDRRLAEKILRTAACMMLATQAHGPYRPESR